MQGMLLLQIQSPWKQNFSLGVLHLWQSKRFFLADIFPSSLWMMNTSGMSHFLLSPLKCTEFLLCSRQCSPWNKGTTSQHVSKISGGLTSLFSSKNIKTSEGSHGVLVRISIKRLSDVAQASSDVKIAMVTTSTVLLSQKSHKTCADTSE